MTRKETLQNTESALETTIQILSDLDEGTRLNNIVQMLVEAREYLSEYIKEQ